MSLLLRWGVATLSLFASVWLLQAMRLAVIETKHWFTWACAAVVMGFVNAFIRPIVELLAAPLNCLTFGLLGIVLNGVFFLLIPAIMNYLGQDVFEVRFVGAIVGAVLVGLINGAMGSLVLGSKKKS